MAFSNSGLYVTNIIDALDTTNLAVNFQLDTHKMALYTNTLSPNFSSDTAYSATNEVSGTGWSAGGQALSGLETGGTSTDPTLTDASGSIKYDMDDVSKTGTTLSLVRGLIVYADALAGDNLLFAVTFGADYSTSSGTFGITWSASGVFAIDITP